MGQTHHLLTSEATRAFQSAMAEGDSPRSRDRGEGSEVGRPDPAEALRNAARAPPNSPEDRARVGERFVTEQRFSNLEQQISQLTSLVSNLAAEVTTQRTAVPPLPQRVPDLQQQQQEVPRVTVTDVFGQGHRDLNAQVPGQTFPGTPQPVPVPFAQEEQTFEPPRTPFEPYQQQQVPGGQPPNLGGQNQPQDHRIATPDRSATGRGEDSNPFKRSEKWMPALPECKHHEWKSRAQETLGFLDYLTDLASWTGLGSNAFPFEILAAIKEKNEIVWERMSEEQITRSIRLLSILKASFGNHARASLIIKNYEESKHRYRCSGYEALRLLALEFGIKSRTELLFFRQQLTGSTFSGATIPESVRKVQYELFRYDRVIQMVDPTVNTNGLEILDADKVLILLRALPQQCRQWVVLNSVVESFDDYSAMALRYEAQQRVWSEQGKPISPFGEDQKGKGKKGKGKDAKGKKGKSGGESGKGKNNDGAETRTCFKCGQRGHLADRCPLRDGGKTNDAKGNKGKGGKGKTSSKGKNSGNQQQKKGAKGPGKGAKGKRATELAASDGATDVEPNAEPSEDDWSEYEYAEQPAGRLSTFLMNPVACADFSQSGQQAHVFEHDLSARARSGRHFRCGMLQRFLALIFMVGSVMSMCISWSHFENIRRELIQLCVQWNVSSLNVPYVHHEILSFNKQFTRAFLSASVASDEEPNYWLVDSGASRTVISEQFLRHYKVVKERTLPVPIVFSTADNSKISIDKEVLVECWFRVHDEETGKTHVQLYEMRCVVGPVQHNLLAVSQLARCGNTFVWDPDGCSIVCGPGSSIHCLIWSGVPWVESRPRRSKTMKKTAGNPNEMDISTCAEQVSPSSTGDERVPSPLSSSSNRSKASLSRLADVMEQHVQLNPRSIPYSLHVKPATVEQQQQDSSVSLQQPGRQSRAKSTSSGKSVQFDTKSGHFHTFLCAGFGSSEEDVINSGSSGGAEWSWNVEYKADIDGFACALDSEDVQDMPIPPPDDIEMIEDDAKHSESDSGSAYSRLRKKDQVELELHRRRGHTPYDSRCHECRMSKSVHQHRRVVGYKTEPIVMADFFYINDMQFVLLTEQLTGMLGVSFMHGNVDHTVANMKQFFEALGCSSEQEVVVEVKIDAERAVATLLRRLPYRMKIVHAAPQSHQTIGLCERGVRKMKEAIGCIRTDLRSNGYDVHNTPTAIETLCKYIAQTNNYFNTGNQGQRRSPMELVTERDCRSPLCSAFGSVVHAKVTDAIRERLPVDVRFIPAAYLFHAFGQSAHEVSTEIEGTIYRFRLEIQLLNKVVWEPRFAPDVLYRLQDGENHDDDDDLQFDDPNNPDNKGVSVGVGQDLPKTGPPIAWVKEHGATPNCPACVKRHGKVHNAACRKRYSDWVLEERKKLVNDRSSSGPGASSSSNAALRPSGDQQGADSDVEYKRLRLRGKQHVPEYPIPVQKPQSEQQQNVPDDGGADVPIGMDEDDYSPTEPADDMDDRQMDVEETGQDAEMNNDAEMKAVFNMLTPDPQAMGEGVGGVMFPMYVPKIGEDFQSSKFKLCGTDVHLIKPVNITIQNRLMQFLKMVQRFSLLKMQLKGGLLKCVQ